MLYIFNDFTDNASPMFPLKRVAAFAATADFTRRISRQIAFRLTVRLSRVWQALFLLWLVTPLVAEVKDRHNKLRIRRLFF